MTTQRDQRHTLGIPHPGENTGQAFSVTARPQSVVFRSVPRRSGEAARIQPLSMLRLLGVVILLAVLAGASPAPAEAAPASAEAAPASAVAAPVIHGTQTGPAVPHGRLTATLSRHRSIIAVGWAVDPDAGAPARVLITVDGKRAKVRNAGRPFPGRGTGGFRIAVRVPSGVHRICARAINVNRGRDRSLGCRIATTNAQAPGDAPSNPAGLGVVTTPTGVVMPVEAINGDGTFQAWTPCKNLITTGNVVHRNRAQVVIDPGHGGPVETGSVGRNGLVERDLNLAVAEVVVDQLNRTGISAQLTRTFDHRLPLSVRGAIANSLDADLFVSIHHNGGTTTTSSEPGTEVWYGSTLPESLRFGRIVWEEMVKSLEGFDLAWAKTTATGASVRLKSSGEDYYGIHRSTPNIPSVITEYVYLSNPAEAELMSQDGMVEREAWSIVNAVLRWYWGSETDGLIGRSYTSDISTGHGGSDNCTDPELGV